ncbi:hypothetical protein NDU88_005244 [Pleurodeles waltl]|uniref:Uncharacterized protein n=1 Tax=Pleurodeles waltl TaxID=8319 RepID=A0AAV7QF42_PLEWA|nr:hypothetical protein NDU88_005244 [Pleurodeles waltl]
MILDTPSLDAATQLSMSDILDKVLAATEHSRVSVETRLGSLASELGFLRDEHLNLVDKVTDGEKTLGVQHLLAEDNQVAIRDLQEHVGLLEDRAEEEEGRS